MKLKLERAINGYIVTLSFANEWTTSAIFEEIDDAVDLFRWYSRMSLENVTMSDFNVHAKIIKAEGEQKRSNKN